MRQTILPLPGWPNWKRRNAAYGLPLAEMVPLLARLLSVPLPAGRYAPLTLTPQQQKQQTLDALVAWLAGGRAAANTGGVGRPARADPTTLEVAELIIEQAPTVPMLHVLTSRPEFSPPWPQRSTSRPSCSPAWSARR